MSPEQPAATTDLVGRTIAGRYTVKRVLGVGGMATVYIAEQKDEPKTIALKIMAPELVAEKNFAKRFQREAKAASSVKHANCVTIYEYGVDGDISYIAMEMVRGDDLYALLEREGALEQTRALRILSEVCDALAVAHELGIVHRDLKPENIMIVSDPAHPEKERVKVLDFGIAKLVVPADQPAPIRGGQRQNSQLTSAGTLLGTPAYMSPEQCALMSVDTRSDIYTCGVLLFQLVTGKLPFEGETPLHTATLHIHREPPKPTSIVPKLNTKLEAIILKALAKKPEERFETAAELAEELRALLPVLPRPDTAAKKPSPPRKKFAQTMPWSGDPTQSPGAPAAPAAPAPAAAPAAVGPPPAPPRPMLGGGALGRGAGLGAVPRPIVRLKQPSEAPPPAPAEPESEPPTPAAARMGGDDDRQRTLIREAVVLPPPEEASAVLPAPGSLAGDSIKPRSGPTGTQVMELPADDVPRRVFPHPTLKSEGFDPPASIDVPLSFTPASVDVLVPSGVPSLVNSPTAASVATLGMPPAAPTVAAPTAITPAPPPPNPPPAPSAPRQIFSVPTGPQPVSSAGLPSVQVQVSMPNPAVGGPPSDPMRAQLIGQAHTMPIGRQEMLGHAIANDPTVESGFAPPGAPQVVVQGGLRPQVSTMQMSARPNIIEPFPIQRPQARGLARLTGPQVLLLGFFAGAVVMAVATAVYWLALR